MPLASLAEMACRALRVARADAVRRGPPASAGPQAPRHWVRLAALTHMLLQALLFAHKITITILFTVCCTCFYMYCTLPTRTC